MRRRLGATVSAAAYVPSLSTPAEGADAAAAGSDCSSVGSSCEAAQHGRRRGSGLNRLQIHRSCDALRARMHGITGGDLDARQLAELRSVVHAQATQAEVTTRSASAAPAAAAAAAATGGSRAVAAAAWRDEGRDDPTLSLNLLLEDDPGVAAAVASAGGGSGGHHRWGGGGGGGAGRTPLPRTLKLALCEQLAARGTAGAGAGAAAAPPPSQHAQAKKGKGSGGASAQGAPLPKAASTAYSPLVVSTKKGRANKVG